MKTKFALMTALLAFSYVFSQEVSPGLRMYSRKVDSIVVSEKAKMNKDLDELDQRYRDNKISSEEKQKQRAEIASQYEAAINEKVSAQQAELENATKEMVKDAVMGRSKRQSLELFSQNNSVLTLKTSGNKTKKELLETFDFNLSYGMMNLTKSASSLDIGNKESQMKPGRSSSSQFEVRYTNQIGSLTSPVFYRLGLGYRMDALSPEKEKVFVQNQDKNIYLTDFTAGTLKKSYFRNHYIVVPVDFVFVLNPKYAVENNEKMLDNSKRNLRLTAGAYGGIRILSQNFTIYKNENNNRVKNIENIRDVANDFIFGGKLAFGYGPFNIFVKKDFTPIFNDRAKINNKYGIQIGFELLYVDF